MPHFAVQHGSETEIYHAPHALTTSPICRWASLPLPAATAFLLPHPVRPLTSNHTSTPVHTFPHRPRWAFLPLAAATTSPRRSGMAAAGSRRAVSSCWLWRTPRTQATTSAGVCGFLCVWWGAESTRHVLNPRKSVLTMKDSITPSVEDLKDASNEICRSVLWVLVWWSVGR